ncbi:hypothetical protein F4861DRAFT_523246 [Xylaria intraflava]|nr:hypothetical protein F4861DRAFT_523246 [Xylaria intraflava]
MMGLIVDSQRSPTQSRTDQSQRQHRQHSVDYPASGLPLSQQPPVVGSSAPSHTRVPRNTPCPPRASYPVGSAPHTPNLPMRPSYPLGSGSHPHGDGVGMPNTPNLPMRPLYPLGSGSRLHGNGAGTPDKPSLPTRPLYPLGLPPVSANHRNEAEKPLQQTAKVASQPTPRMNPPMVAKNPPQPKGLSASQLWLQWKLEDELYPFRLIRQLNKIPNQTNSVMGDDVVFGVIHVDASKENGLKIEHVGSYSNNKAANDRVLDLWNRKYGTKMFTENPQSTGAGTMSLGRRNMQKIGGRSQYTPSQYISKTLSWGGVPENNSHWTIDHGLLCLEHRDDKGEKKIYAMSSCVRDRGFHL